MPYSHIVQAVLTGTGWALSEILFSVTGKITEPDNKQNRKQEITCKLSYSTFQVVGLL
jgi:hypothetical protein